MTVLRSFLASSRIIAPAMGLLLLAGCANSRPVSDSEYNNEPGYQGGGSLLSDNGITFGVGKNSNKGNQSALGVNAFLWRGALDTLSFMPLASADPFGGVIITDWYSPPGVTGERFKATAYILGRQLRADGVRISIFRQVLQNGQWVDADVSPATVGDIENKVLDRARQLRDQATGSANG
ncbi:MAG: DUF3576 domain-containing protein [Rhodospirillales bacterium]|nr:DUF3576 domain-containing protein [Rhodospirillales bacterium]